MIRHPPSLPQFVRDLLASPPHRGDGLNLWFYRVARVLHPYRDSAEIIELLRAATAGEPVKSGEIERAVERSAATAWKPGQPKPLPHTTTWPILNAEQREAVIATVAGNRMSALAGIINRRSMPPKTSCCRGSGKLHEGP